MMEKYNAKKTILEESDLNFCTCGFNSKRTRCEKCGFPVNPDISKRRLCLDIKYRRKKMKYKMNNKKSEVMKLREEYNKKRIELINITHLCEVRIGESGWCNDFNEPDETIHHIKLSYKDEFVTTFPNPERNTSEGFIIYQEMDKVTGNDFIVFMKVKRLK